MSRSYIFKGVFISLFLLGSSALHAQATTPKKPFWSQHSFYLDGGAMLVLFQETTDERGNEKLFSIKPYLFPFPLIDIGWKGTDELATKFFWSASLYYSTTNYFNLLAGWIVLLMPNARLSLEYVHSRDMLFTLGLGTRGFLGTYGSLAMDIPFSKHGAFSVEASFPISDHVNDTMRITAKLGYKF